MSVQPFMHLRLVGSRYDDHSVPLEFLKDLAVLEEMVVEVAKHKFLEDHPDRQRSPRGFTRNLHLRLSAINPGSAAMDIRLVSETPSLFPTTDQNYLARARDGIIETIDAAKHQQSFESFLPESMLGYFDKLGRNLKADELIEFKRPDGRLTASLSRDVRRRLVLSSPKVKELTEEISIRGTVPEADQDDMTFEIQLIEGRKLKGPIASQHLDTILKVFNGYQNGVRALFQGIGRFSRGDQLIGFDSIEHLSVLDPLDFGVQFDELRLLQDGWLDGDGKAPSSAGLNWLHEAFEYNYPDEIPLPHLYPTETGGVQAEWTLDPNEISLDLNLENHLGEWHVLNLMSDDVSERTLNCDDASDWRWMVDRIKHMTVGDV